MSGQIWNSKTASSASKHIKICSPIKIFLTFPQVPFFLYSTYKLVGKHISTTYICSLTMRRETLLINSAPCLGLSSICNNGKSNIKSLIRICKTNLLSAQQTMRVYPKVSRLAAWSKNCKWCSSLSLGAVVSLFCESV
jgi:hypothetical protein